MQPYVEHENNEHAPFVDDKILTFSLNNEEFGIDIFKVNEIRGWNQPSIIPGVPEYVKGVLNLHGKIIPIIDLRIRFCLTPLPYGPTTVVILLNIHKNNIENTIGIVVDSVSDTYTLGKENIREKPTIGGFIDVEYIKGLVDIDNQLISLLDVNKLLSDQHYQKIIDEI